MDGSSSDHSRAVSENTNGSWNWDTEDVSISRLHLGGPEPPDDLQDLVEDKEIAACAVAFVVNGTRRGIVPLCADVASLMRSKRRLEKRVVRLKREVEALRRVSQHSSHSLSPTPTSVHSYSSSRGSFMDPAHVQVFNELLRGAQCSDVTSHSSDSSQIGSSPTPNRRNRGALHRTTACVPIRNQLAPVTIHRSVGDVRSANHLVEVYESVGDNDLSISHDKSCTIEADMSADSTLHFDSGIENGSLSSRVVDCHSFPDEDDNRGPVNIDLDKVTADNQKSLAASSSCCCLSTASGMSLEDRFNKTMETNMKLAHELATTRRQMELLTTKLREFELHELSRRDSCNQSHGRQVNKLAETSSSTSIDLLSTSASASSIGATDSTSLHNTDTSSQEVKPQHLKSNITSVDIGDLNKSSDAVVDVESVALTSDKSVNCATKPPLDTRSSRSMLRPLHRSKALNKCTADGVSYVDSYV